MFQRFLNWIRQVISRMVNRSDVVRASGIDVPVSAAMVDALELWRLMYINQAPWLDENVKSLQLPAAIAGEFARLVTLEMKTEITGSLRADFLSACCKDFLEDIDRYVERGGATGGAAFKPYVTADRRLTVDVTPADRFFPTSFDGSGRITGGVFIDRETVGKSYYTRYEIHQLSGTTYTIKNVAYRSDNEATQGSPVSLGAVPRWAELDPEVTFGNITQPLFGYFVVPIANNVDPDSPLGVSVYSRAATLIRQADEQWARIQWEYKATEVALDISDRAYKLDDQTGKPVIPAGQKRLVRPMAMGSDEHPLYQVYAPTIRDASQFAGLNRIFQRIEFNVGLAYGTISDPNTVDKTAEEIKSSKQRSYSTISKMQRALERALSDMIYAMDTWATLAKLAPAGKYEVAYEWDDSIVTDMDKEFNQRLQLLSAGVDRPDEMRQWYHGETEEEAKKNLPEMSALLGG